MSSWWFRGFDKSHGLSHRRSGAKLVGEGGGGKKEAALIMRGAGSSKSCTIACQLAFKGSSGARGIVGGGNSAGTSPVSWNHQVLIRTY